MDAQGGLSSGSVLAGKYLLEERLGEGGMGVVWRAARIADGARVAIKVLKADSVAPATLRRFAREAQALSAVRHPNVVVVHEVVELGDRPALVLELLEGESLAQRLARERRLSPEDAAEISMSIAAAVGAAHALGIVHRDLKPANVLLARSGEGTVVKVLDFGIAKWLRPASGGVTTLATATGGLLGTPCYMSPEQAFGDAIDHRSDLWSLGMIAYECLSGVLPTRAENVGRVLKILLQGRFRPLAQLAPELPAGLSSLVDDLLRTEPSERPADVREVVRRLEPHTRHRVPPIPAPLAPPRGPRQTTREAPWEPGDTTADVDAPEAMRARAVDRVASPWRGLRAGAMLVAAVSALAGLAAVGAAGEDRARDAAMPSAPGVRAAPSIASPPLPSATVAAASPAPPPAPPLAPSSAQAPPRHDGQPYQRAPRSTTPAPPKPASSSAPHRREDAEWPTEFGP